MEKTFDPIAYANSVGKDLVSAFEKADLATTRGQVGDAKEKAAKDKLGHILPPGIAVGSGFIIDSYGNTSRQIDVVLYEKNICPVYSINDTPETTYYPCEGVVAVGEIKSALNSDELEDIFLKIESTKRLKRFSTETPRPLRIGELRFPYRHYGTTGPATHGNPGTDYYQEGNPQDQIFGFALAGKLKLKPQTLCEKFINRASEIEPILTPNLIVTLDQGILCPATIGKKNKEDQINISIQDATGIYHANKDDENFRFLLSQIYDMYNHGRTVPVSAFGRYFDHEGVLMLPEGGIYVPIEKQISESNE